MFKPTKDNVFVQFEEKKKESQGGIILQSNLDTTIGVVVGIGKDVSTISVGDRIIADWSKAQIVDDGVISVKEDVIVAVVEQ